MENKYLSQDENSPIFLNGSTPSETSLLKDKVLYLVVNTKRMALTGILFLFTLSTFSQQYTFINYSTENGLAQSQVSAMCQDKGGYIWFATFGGLSRFDGKTFVNYTKSDGLLDNQLYSICIDSKERILTGTI